MSSSASTLAGAGGGASAGGPGPSGARAGDDDYPQDQVKVYSHEGDGENTEHLISMDLHDVKTEMAKDAENAETPKNAANASSSTVQTSTTTAALAGLRPLIQHPTMVYANGTFMMPPFPAGTPLYPVMRPVKMEAGSDWKVSQGQISIPAYSYPAGFLPAMEHGSLRPATAYPFMIPGPYVAATPYQHQLTTLGQPVAPNATVSPHSGMVAPQVKEKKQHIKKPLNAFMLFMKEKRADVIKECTLKESAAINQILGKMWHALDRSEQAKYYEMAREERAKHMQMYPGWSARDNYAVHKKRRKRKTKTVDGNKQSSTPSTGGGSTTDDQDSHNAANDSSNDIDDPNARKCRARFGLDQQHLWCNPCKRKKKCTKFSEDEDDSAPKAYHGELEDDVISSDTKSSNSAVGGDKVPHRSGGVADALTTKTTVQSETSSHGNGQMDRSVSQSEQRVMHAPITLQTIPST